MARRIRTSGSERNSAWRWRRSSRTAAETIAELAILLRLVEQARCVVNSGLDRKWDELSKILQNDPNMRDAGGRQRKMIVSAEHRDTLNYLERQIGVVLGTPDAIVTIHGGTHVSFSASSFSSDGWRD
jgi:hypothetical protein